jgi:Zn finger protein HypA/HybF involved in hydrogenase expression
MHEISLLEKIFQYLEREERNSRRPIKKAYISLSEFGDINETDFLQHYQDKKRGTKWESLDLEIKKVKRGPGLKITRLDFA